MVSHSRTQGGQWSRWIGGGALVLALAGLLAPATTSAVINIGHEKIEIEGEAPEAPWTPPTGAAIRGGARRTVRRAGTVEAEAEAEAGAGATSPGSWSPTNDPQLDYFYGLTRQIREDCARFGGTYSWTEFYELDTNGDVVDSQWYAYCYLATQDGWVQNPV